jgi:hypothetical protein
MMLSAARGGEVLGREVGEEPGGDILEGTSSRAERISR